MPRTASAKKRLRQTERRRSRNRTPRSRARTFIKEAIKLTDEGKKEEAQEMTRQATSALDRAVAKGVVHKNTAARHKSRLMKRLNRAPAKKAKK